jgi:putative acetyltransferase
MIALRRFETGDAAVCCQLINASIRTMEGLNEAARALVVSKNTAAALAAELAQAFALVALGDLRVVGLGVLDGAEIKRLYVDPACQRQGTGRRLLAALEDEARQRGLPRLELQASLPSLAFYLAHGFQALGRETTHNGPATFVHVRMAKALVAS